jgi:hypothetical protein
VVLIADYQFDKKKGDPYIWQGIAYIQWR